MASNVIDFQVYGLDVKDTSQVSNKTIQTLGRKMVDTLKKYNFCYLSNHGVPTSLTERYMEASRQFFKLPKELKSKFCLDKDYKFGWASLEATHTNADRSVGDLHEAFNYTPHYDTAWPPLGTFETLTKEFYSAGETLALRICDALSLGLGLPIDHMRNTHKLVGRKGNSSCIRTVYYPAIPPDMNIPDDQARIGEHADYDVISLDFQDQVGGLEIETPEGEFVPVDPTPGTVVVYGGTAMKPCSLGALSAVRHRVPIPNDDQRCKQRSAIVFFLLPDDDFVVSSSTHGEHAQTHRELWESWAVRGGLYQPKE